MDYLVTPSFFEGWGMCMVLRGRKTSGSSFGKVSASRATPFVMVMERIGFRQIDLDTTVSICLNHFG